MNNSCAGESERKTILTYPGIITWHEHMQIVTRLDSRAHRKGISSYNVALLTGILFDPAGHVLYHVKDPKGHRYYYCRKRCSICPPMKEMDEHIAQAVILFYGEKPHKVRRVIPGKNNFEEIARLRQDRAELDDLADDYQERHSELTAEIRRLAKEDKENPKPDEIRWVDSDQTIAEYWLSLTTTAERHDWLIENEWKVTVSKSGKRWTLTIAVGSLGAESITWSPEQADVTAEASRTFDIPATINDAVAAANVFGELPIATKWKRSAIVRAFCEPSQGQRTDLGEKSPKLSFTEFADRRVIGLASRKAVRHYFDAWGLTGLPAPKPGQTIELPSADVEFSAMVNRP